jgi:hypothetical protein
MPDGEYGLVANAAAASASPSALVTIDESASKFERKKSTTLSVGDARVAGHETLLRGPIASRLIGLAFPILIVLAVQTLVSVAETYFVGFLGDDALAGVALVFPIIMLMTMMSNGGIGGGVASAIARAIGAGRMRDAEALMGHSVGYRRRIRCRCSPLRYWALVKRCSVHSAAAAKFSPTHCAIPVWCSEQRFRSGSSICWRQLCGAPATFVFRRFSLP